MHWFVNDLSFQGQFSDPLAFKECMLPVLQLLTSRRDLRRRILCSRGLKLRPVTRSLDLQEAVRSTRDQLFLRQMLDWVSNSGPFWDDDRAANEDDLFYFEDDEVTDQGLGEAARRLVNGMDARSFSFVHHDFRQFAQTPLPVLHGIKEQPLGIYEVDNCWAINDIAAASAARVPQSWPQLLDQANNMPGLVISKQVTSQLAPVPFHSGLAQKLLTLLGVLQQLTRETTKDGLLTEIGKETHRLYFTGHNPSFTDSSSGEKQQFKRELTFVDPSDRTRTLFCTWHGKAKFGYQFRIHFEWPRPAGQREIKIVHIGKKITLT